jgi:hypothetical protein
MRMVRPSVLGVTSSPSRQEARSPAWGLSSQGSRLGTGRISHSDGPAPMDVGTIAEQARDGRYGMRPAESSNPRVTRLRIMVLSSPGPIVGQTTS